MCESLSKSSRSLFNDVNLNGLILFGKQSNWLDFAGAGRFFYREFQTETMIITRLNGHLNSANWLPEIGLSGRLLSASFRSFKLKLRARFQLKSIEEVFSEKDSPENRSNCQSAVSSFWLYAALCRRAGHFSEKSSNWISRTGSHQDRSVPDQG